ncbi:MAG: Cellulose biosynthesis protein BcsS, partial [Bradyrhizobium sp.]|nr:Cellulose biosynthesis protein BcsS [Bradyrhizobium sp.]
TGFKLDALEWSVAIGYVTDSYHRSGVYGRIGVLTRQ